MTDPYDKADGGNAAKKERGSRIRSLRSPSDAIRPESVPPPPPTPPRERNGLVHLASNFLTFFVFASIAIAGGFYVLKNEFRAPGPLQSDKVIIVKGGSQAVTDTLAREGVIAQPTLFLLGLHLFGTSDEIKAGEYLFKQNASLRAVMDTLIAGKSVLHTLTIPEGLTSEQVVGRLMESDLLIGTIKEIPREGALLPETYKIPRGTPRQQLIDRMRADSKRVLAEVWARRSPDLPVKSPEELVTLASIVEKETGRADERPRVAGVFINRMQKRMRLQSDPTIVYGLVGGKGTLGRAIQRSEITKPTPYNTYVIDGLPPGPIANPGRAALEAVANPSRTKEVFFVADGTGGHVFSETLDQHNRNVGRWRQIEATRKSSDGADDVDRSAPPAAPAPGPSGWPGAGPARDNRSAVDGGVDGATGGGSPAERMARPRAFDASEGTKLDPLRNKTYDLNSTQTVPKLR
ncbi:endolytic transglycosylase MltG [Chelatococcus reniformis]|uniref:Endolytic murein transglycosylase n=1 Tax=Chelatococcus reniformis TaxID=1494448 RepID=A0A916UDK2_9HYPH|nr:endolytic transglycosylase MltG [Chelatococcus reniformis]GGC69076.1 aminodeoxychorismate lyase [Chelatococcus reniformis]